MSKHTPGPWVIDNVGDIATSDPKVVGNIVCLQPEDYEESMQYWPGNQRLIAAAPELLEALRVVREHIEYGLFNDARARIDAALKKAGAA